ncbi:MAG: sugar ABC transporter substrate-binding protein [Acidimicrobiales bacterium]
MFAMLAAACGDDDDTASSDDGAASDDGSSGDDGAASDDGSSGDDGAASDDGSSGDDGAASDDGSSGDDGAASDDGSSGDDGATADPLKIAYIQTGSFDYYQSGVDGTELLADELGVELIVLNSDLDAETEIANVEDALTQDIDGLVVFSVTRASEEATLNAANDAGVPTAVLYGYAPELEDQGVVFVQAGVEDVGRIAGTWMADNIESGEVAMIQGALGRGDVEGYTAGWQEGVASNSDLEIVAEISANWSRAEAVTVMEDIITANPDLVGVWVNNEDMAIGAIQAIEAAGLSDQITVVSMNGSPEGLAAVESGQIAATVGWSPAQEAQMALVRLVDYVRNGVEPDQVLCSPPLVLITEDNLDAASPWVPTAESTAAAVEAACFSS